MKIKIKIYLKKKKKKKYFSYYILLTDQMSMSGCL